MKNKWVKSAKAAVLAVVIAVSVMPITSLQRQQPQQVLAAQTAQTKNMALGDAFTITLGAGTTYQTSNKKVFTVTKNGEVSAVGVGIANLTMKKSGYTSVYKIKVTLTGNTTYDKKLKTIANKLAKGKKSDAAKVKAVHDYIIKNTAYDYDNYIINQIPKADYTAVGLLKNKTAVCEGYAKTFYALMNLMNIPCKMVTGKGNGGDHAWNLINLGGKWYHIDVTWDDPVPDQKGYIGYGYFLLSDQEMARDHTWTKSDFPKCTASADPYISLFGAVCDDSTQLKKQVAKIVKGGSQTVWLALKTDSGLTTQSVFDEFYRQDDQCKSLKYGMPEVRGSYTLLKIIYEKQA